MDEAWYQQTLQACALLPDLQILPGGDQTQIGEKGINLSGGQKARVALARAVYARAPTVVLDDPLSAVDAHVGRHIFREVLSSRGLLAGTTRILVTHQTQFLPIADKIVVLDKGQVLAEGSYQDLVESTVDLTAAVGTLKEGVDAHDLIKTVGEEDKETGGASKEDDPKARSEMEAGDLQKDNAGSQIVMEEERATGSVSWQSHLDYLNSMGGIVFGLILLFAVCWERFVGVATDYWLALWIDPSTSPIGKETPRSDEISFWIPIYVGIVCVAGVSVYCRSYFFGIFMGLRSARVLYKKLSAAVVAAPMIFFETTPSGRILNRFTSDTEQMDFGLLSMAAQWINCVASVGGSIVLICTVNPWFAVALPVLMLIYGGLYYTSASATRDLQRLEAVSRSPIFTQFSETLNGLSTIRAFGATSRFQSASLALITRNTRCYFNQDLAAQWIALRLDFCSGLIAALTVVLPILIINFSGSMGTSPAAFGLCIAYSLELSAFLKFGTKGTLELQKGLAAVERILEYARDTPKEKVGGEPVPATVWPSQGRIVVQDLCVRYRPELPLALCHVNCTIEPRSKVGIVGRTGSGKTTFVSTLWRLVEPTCGDGGDSAGALTIDGIDISKLELHGLRSRLAIIVQDPVLFNDSVKYNLDPFDKHTEEELRTAISNVELHKVIDALPKGLDSPVGEAGANFSVGQRQLICLARAMLRKSALITLDEATASIDNETDAILQSTIRKVFADATVLTIAHRLHTIMDSTQILLFDKGELKEQDSPEVLLEDDSSLFSKLIADTGSAAEHLHKLAAEGAAARKAAAL